MIVAVGNILAVLHLAIALIDLTASVIFPLYNGSKVVFGASHLHVFYAIFGRVEFANILRVSEEFVGFKPFALAFAIRSTRCLDLPDDTSVPTSIVGQILNFIGSAF